MANNISLENTLVESNDSLKCLLVPFYLSRKAMRTSEFAELDSSFKKYLFLFPYTCVPFMALAGFSYGVYRLIDYLF